MLNREQCICLQAIAAEILPSEDGPGAVECGVADYICRLVSEPRMRPSAAFITSGLDRLDRVAQCRYRQRFGDLASSERRVLLEACNTGDQPADRAWFRLLVALCVEGFLCDPARGGNRGGLGWTYIGYEPESTSCGT